MKKIQLAKIYSGDSFKGFGIAVDGELLEMQGDTSIETCVIGMPTIKATFSLKDEHVENVIRIQV